MSAVSLLLALAALVLIGCGETPSGGGPSHTRERADPEIVADEATLPAEDAYEFAAVAPDARELGRQWRRFGLSGEPMDVDFETRSVLFVGFGESGSCPYKHGGVDVDVAAKRVSFIDEGEDPEGCTDDYNPRTLAFAIERSLLPDGVFQVEPPGDGGAVSVAGEPVETPPQEDPASFSASISEVYVTLDPEPVMIGDELRVRVRNESGAQVATARVHLDRWTGLAFEPAESPQVRGDGNVITIEARSEQQVATIDVAGDHLTTGWYRVTVDLYVQSGGYGRLLIRRAVAVVEPRGG